jgi:hypothetical protein
MGKALTPLMVPGSAALDPGLTYTLVTLDS